VKRRHIVLGAISALALTIGGIAPAASATTSHSGTEHFLILQTNETSSPPVIGTGPIHAAGTDLQLNNHHDRFVFPRGALGSTTPPRPVMSPSTRRPASGRSPSGASTP